MTSLNYESMTADSLSDIFKKPKPVLKAHRKEPNARSLSNSIDSTTSSHTILAAKTATEQNTPKILKTSANFSGFFDSINESVPTVKKRRISQPKESVKVSFSKSVSGYDEDSVVEPKAGYLRQLRQNAKPSKEANFSTDSSINDSARDASRSTSKSIENISTPNLSLSFSPLLNSSGKMPRMRRCSTPLNGTSHSKMLETNLSLIPRALSFDNELSSSSPPSPQGSQNSNRSLQWSCSTASLVTKVFHRPQSIDSNKENVMVPTKKMTGSRKADPDFKIKSKFPKLAPYYKKWFYEYVISKMEPKYGIKTKHQVVKVAQEVHTLVQNIISTKENYHELVHQLKILLCQREIIRTTYDLYLFSLKFLPREAINKIVPIIRPFGAPLLADFNPETVFEPIKIDE